MAIDFSKYGTPTVTPTSSVDFSKYGAPISKPTIEQKNPNYFQRVGGEFSKAASDIKEGISKGSEQYLSGITEGTIGGEAKATAGLLRTGLRTAGGVAGAAFSPITEAPGVRQILSGIAQGISKIPGAKSLISNAEMLAQKHPELAKDIKNIVDLATLGTGRAVEAPLKEEAKLVGQDIIGGAKAILTPSEEAITSKVQDLFSRAIKPTGKKTLAQSERYQNDVVEALTTVKDNIPNLNLEDASGELVSRAPQSINELAQALDQTKKEVFKQYDALAKQATNKGVEINVGNIGKELDTVISNKALQITNPEVISYAQSLQARLMKFGVDENGKLTGYLKLDPETVQAIIENYNKSLSAFYRNPTYESATRAAIDAGVVNNFRKALDTAIEGATGEQYQALKNKYSSLKAIENDVIRAANRDARKNTKGLLDYTDIFTGGQMLGGIMSLNPAMFTKGAVERGIKEYIKFLNDPNRAISTIFSKLETATSEFAPKSAVGKYLKNPSFGLSIEDVSRNIPANDRSLMIKFIDQAQFPKENILSDAEFNSVETIARGMGISMDEGIGKVAEKFRKILEGGQHFPKEERVLAVNSTSITR